MKKKNVLILAATDLSDDNSASLCHTAYIRGFFEAGHCVDVISVTPTALKYMHEVKGVTYHYFSDENLIIRKVRKKRNGTINNTNFVYGNLPAKTNSLICLLRKIVIRAVGATNTFSRRVCKYKIEKDFTLFLSLSSPPESHEIAQKMIKRNKVKAEKWCQLWEDPWSTDLYNVNPEIRKREKKILDAAQQIIYVSPMTLERQKDLFSNNAYKMKWLPLPTYYEEELSTPSNAVPVFGYFGQYFPHVRNIKPVYETLNKLGIKFILCGEPHDLLEATECVEIYPRIPPDELKRYEERVDVLVFVSNTGGGQIPGKIYQYSGTNKPILFILDGNEDEKRILREYFGQYNRYHFADNNIRSIERAIKAIIQKNIGTINNFPVDYFEGRNIANLIIQINENL